MTANSYVNNLQPSSKTESHFNLSVGKQGPRSVHDSLETINKAQGSS